jgi:quaternary ammonium compound-resistance protein SugE
VTRAWLLLCVAGVLEVVWAVGLKTSHGFTRPVVAAVTVTAYLLSFVLLALAMRTLPAGTAYAVWTGIGVVGVAVIGLVYLGESRDFWRLASMALILAGIIGLRLTARA